MARGRWVGEDLVVDVKDTGGWEHFKEVDVGVLSADLRDLMPTTKKSKKGGATSAGGNAGVRCGPCLSLVVSAASGSVERGRDSDVNFKGVLLRPL